MSPTIFRHKQYKFFFFSRGEAKFWLEPKISLAGHHHLKARALKEIEAIIEEHFDEICKAWKKHFRS